jgi:hypothetical protein
MRKICFAAITFCLLTLCATAQPTQQDIMAAMELANDYFIQKYPDAGAPTFVKRERPSNLWTRGVYFEGLYALADLERQLGGERTDAYFKYIMDWGTGGNLATA